MNHNKITELLKNYRSYKYAVQNGIAPHDEELPGMPFSSTFGSRIPRLYGRGSWEKSIMDYRLYSYVVSMIDGAVRDVLTDDERKVIELKYLDRNPITLEKIADRIGCSERTIRRYHKNALKKLTLALGFIEVPEIINLDSVLA